MLLELPHAFWVAVAVSLGLVFGSFLNVVIHRLPRGESVVSPPSHCPGCGASIRATDNIPVLSWVVLRGRARCCGVSISPRYPLVEAAGGVFGWACMEKVIAEAPVTGDGTGALVLFGAYLALCLGLVAAVFIDLEFMVLPDEITLGGAALGIATAGLRHLPWADSLLGGVFGFGLVWLPFVFLYRLLRGQAGMGMGDAKLLLLTGAWFGWQGAVFALMAGAVQGTLGAIVLLLVKGRIDEPEAVTREREEATQKLETLAGEERERFLAELGRDPLALPAEAGIGKIRMAFGPFLALATLEYLFFGEALIEGYLWTILPG